jgi:hypothetical protein
MDEMKIIICGVQIQEEEFIPTYLDIKGVIKKSPVYIKLFEFINLFLF